MEEPKPLIFISYSRCDRKWLEFVQSHLQVAVANGHFETWDDGRIAGGADWRKEIDDALSECAVFVLLVSRHSLVSDFILKTEVQAALEAHRQRGTRIYPIIVEACDFQAVPWLAAIGIRPRDARPLESFPPHQRNEVMASIAAEIRSLVMDQNAASADALALAPGDALAPAFGDALATQTSNVRGDGNIVVQIGGSGNTLSINGRK